MLNLNDLKPSIQCEMEKIKQQNFLKTLTIGISISTISITLFVIGVGYLFKSKFSIEGNLPDFYLSFMGIAFKLVYLVALFIFSCVQSSKEYLYGIITNIILSGDSEPKLTISKFIVYNCISTFILVLQTLLVLFIYILLPESEITSEKIKPFFINFLFLILMITLAVVFTILTKSSGLGILIGILYILGLEIIIINVLNLFNEKFFKYDWLSVLLGATPVALIQKISNSTDGLEIFTNLFFVIGWVLLILFFGFYLSKNRQIHSR